MSDVACCKYSPLHAWHLESGAVFEDVAGWMWAASFPSQPVDCVPSGLITSDLSPLTRICLKGDAAQKLFTLSPESESLSVGLFTRTTLSGSNALVCRPVDDEFIVIGSPDAHAELTSTLLTASASAQDITGATALFALMGETAGKAFSYLSSLDTHPLVFPAGSVTYTSFCFARTLVIRTEMGFYLMVPADYADFVWRSLIDAGIPSGIQVAGFKMLGSEVTLL